LTVFEATDTCMLNRTAVSIEIIAMIP